VAPAPVTDAHIVVAAPGGTHTVVAGDSLYAIARSLLGSGSRWGEIFELNSDLINEPNVIQIGWQLRLPA